MATKTLQCEILSPEGSVYRGEATMVVATAVDGELGVLYNHAPLVTALGSGSLRTTSEDGTVKEWTAEGGFLEVHKNHVTILSDKISEKA